MQQTWLSLLQPRLLLAPELFLKMLRDPEVWTKEKLEGGFCLLAARPCLLPHWVVAGSPISSTNHRLEGHSPPESTDSFFLNKWILSAKEV